jgi:uncharacterized protein
MKKRVVIVHRWTGSPEEDWIPWIRSELVQRNFTLEVPPMPDSDHPTKELWIPFLRDIVGHCDEHTYFIGHSIGCQTIIRYIQELPLPARVGGLVLVAPWVRLKAKELDEDDKKIAEPWIKDPIHWEAVQGKIGQCTAIFSDDDYYVYVKDAKIFQTGLNADIQILHKRGHFTSDDEETTLPEALDALLDMSSKNP